MKLIRRYSKHIASFMLVTTLYQFCNVQGVFALTGGPTAPEASGFSPAGASDMVDPFTGDFKYGIPLLDVGGYPLAMNYSAGITPDQEASWVGLGWNLNVGDITRNVRGIPDDFAGDIIETEHSIKPNQTFGVTFQPGTGGPSEKCPEALTFKTNVSQNFNVFYNTYTGFGFSYSYSPSLDIAIIGKDADSPFKLGATPSLNLSIGSEDGVGISPNVGLSTEYKDGNTESSLNANIGFPFSSREGAKGLSMSSSFRFSSGTNLTSTKKDEKGEDQVSTATNGSSRGPGASGFIGFATPTYPTNIGFDNYSINASLNLSPEQVGDKFICDKSKFIIGGYYRGQFDENTNERNPAYGYMYEGATSDENAVLDFNREKEQGFNLKTTNMPVTNHTYDTYSVSGEGIGGTFRLYRSDVPMVGDNVSSSRSISPDLNVSGGTGQTASFTHLKIGVDFKYIQGDSKSGRWTNLNKVQHSENPNSVLNSEQQNVYFGLIGDATPENNSDFFNNSLLGTDLYQYELNQGFVTGEYKKGDGSIGPIRKNGENNSVRNKRKNRSNSFVYLKASDAEKFALDDIYNYKMNQFRFETGDNNTEQNLVSNSYPKYEEPIDRVGGVRKANHLSEIRVTNNSGQRYIYGIPVYNKIQHDVTFSVDTEGSDIASIRQSGLVGYSPEDASTDNNNGLEHYYQRKKQPGYSTQHLLTNILSSDYIDKDDIEGPSDGDLGTFVKFNYTKTSDDYRWRSPFDQGKANYADGLAGKRNDDKGSYTYGEKEVWYVHSIETRTHVAEFYLSNRDDGLGVKDEHGGLESTISEGNRLKKLDKIVLYAKRDKLNGKNEPLKTVHFEYDYSLCKGTPNSIAANGNGKLTLKKVWFTYGNSDKGGENPYVFNYGDQNFDGVPDVELNPNYDKMAYDRWGCYKKQPRDLDLADCPFNIANCDIGNEEYPYTLQDKDLTDEFVAVYSMTQILTPNGGDIRVHYESDDYAYVQNKGAMRMYNILGVSNSKTDETSITSNLYDGALSNLDERKYLYIDLGEGFDEPNQLDYFKNNYLDDIENLQYRINLDVISGQSNEYVTGYCNLNTDDFNVIKSQGSSNYDIGVIALNSESLNNGNNKNLHPFIKAGWLYARMHYNRELNGSYSADDNGFLQILGGIASSANSVIELVFGFKNYMKTNGHSSTLVPKKSFVRMYDPDGFKLGGGIRVKAVIMFDRWDEMTSNREQNSTVEKEVAGYGQVYDYTIQKDPTDPNSPIISSGIAAYEPILGGEENPWRRLVKTVDKVPLAPNKEFYTETPYGESFFPAPVVGYRKVRTTPVKVISKSYDVDLLQSNGTGYVEDEFYTAYDFPTFVSQTDLQMHREKSSPIPNPLKYKSHDHVFCSQGYLIENNDMHGKVKSKKVMPDKVTGDVHPVSFVEYQYKVETNNAQKLNSQVALVDNNLKIIDEQGRELATSVDVVNDTRYYESLVRGGGADINVRISTSALPPFVLPVVTAFPDINIERTSFSSITTTKVVNRYGVLTKTVAHENGQNITTENLAWDEKTGAVLLTKVDNEFHDEIYNFTYPAHWAYKEMGMAYENNGLRFTDLSQVLPIMVDGDEVMVRTNDPEAIKTYFDAENNQLIDKNGVPVSSFIIAQLMRSGARNVPQIPVGSITMLENPIDGNQISFDNKSILNTGASEFRNSWKGFCNCGEQSVEDPNPFITGERGQLRAWRSWTYLTGREQSVTNGELNIRNDGDLTDYLNFWQPGGNYLSPFYSSIPEDDAKWQFVTEVENFNPLGQEIENKDALERFSMAQYGYSRALPVGVSNNSRYQESGYDGFEDYGYDDCNDDHFSWRVRQNDPNSGPVSTESHSGKKSFKVGPGEKSKIVKTIGEACED